MTTLEADVAAADDEEAPASVRTLQQWFFQAITRPHITPHAPEDPQLPAALMERSAESVIRPSATLAPEARIQIYSDMYFWRLLGSLVEDFPSVRALLGKDDFEAMVRDYLSHHPSRSFTLNHLGYDLPDFIRGAWRGSDASLLADVAALEDAINRAFSAPDTPVLTPEALQSIPPEAWGEVRFEMTGGFQLLALEHNSNAILNHVRDHKETPPPEALRQPQPSWVVVWRRDLVAWRQTLSWPRFTLLSALAAGEPMGDAIEVAIASWSDSEEGLEAQIFSWFSSWIGEGFFATFSL